MSDVVVIGSGADELVAARLLAQGGHRVTVLQEYAPLDRVEGWAPRQIGELESKRPDPWLRTPEGLELSADMTRSLASIRRLSARDAEQWPQFCERMARLAALLERIYLEPPPSLVDLR
ncbi:MAG TPA: hypothetical protein VM183_17000, partial [Burkholderiales bacterium]|nr:hypothetical protein [Burkholderiales bacterium]